MLDKSKPYGEVQGGLKGKGVAYEQDCKLYNIQGLQIDSQGNLLEEMPVKKPSIPEVVEEKKEPSKPLSWSDDPNAFEKNDTEENLMLVDRIKIRFPGDPNFLKKAEIIEELKTRKIEFSEKDGRDDLLGMLKSELGI